MPSINFPCKKCLNNTVLRVLIVSAVIYVISDFMSAAQSLHTKCLNNYPQIYPQIGIASFALKKIFPLVN